MSSGRQVGAWTEVREEDPHDRQSYPIEFFLFALLPLPLTVPVINLPLPEIAGLVLVARGFLRAPDPDLRRPGWFAGLLVALWLWFAAVAFLREVDGTRRLGHLAIYILLALCLSSGRLHRLSAVRGTAVGLAVGAVSGFLGGRLGLESTYVDRLTGLFSDPNVAGFTMVVLGAIAVTGARSGIRRWLGMLGLLVAILLTLSRTSITAAVLGGAWLVLRRVLPRGWSLAAMIGLSFAVADYARTLKNWGPFADREGSDALRELIQIAEHALLDQSPWIGHGPGTARVVVGGEYFFFHNSYFALRAEGGWIGLAIFLMLGALLVWRLVSMPEHQRHPWYEAAIIMVAICALNLGEVLLEMPTAVVLGIAMRHLLRPDELLLGDPRNTPDHVL